MKGRVLIVDDSTQSLVSLTAHLLNEGYSVVTARSMTEAVSLASGCFPNLVVSEVLMPHMRISEFVEKIRQIDPTHPPPIILMSDRANKDAEKTASELGAAAYLEKPISWTTISKTVEGVLVKARHAAMRAPNNQRKHPRVPFHCEAYFECDGATGFGVVSDLSKGGLFLATGAALRPGAVINVTLKILPGWDVEVFGEVRYTGRKDMKKGIGVKFLRMAPNAMQAIERIIKDALRENVGTTLIY